MEEHDTVDMENMQQAHAMEKDMFSMFSLIQFGAHEIWTNPAKAYANFWGKGGGEHGEHAAT